MFFINRILLVSKLYNYKQIDIKVVEKCASGLYNNIFSQMFHFSVRPVQARKEWT